MRPLHLIVRDWMLAACVLGAVLYLSASCGGDGTHATAAQAQKSTEFLAVERCLGLEGYEPPTVYEPAIRCRAGFDCCLASYREKRSPGQPPEAISYFSWAADEFQIVMADGDARCDQLIERGQYLRNEFANAILWQNGDYRDAWCREPCGGCA